MTQTILEALQFAKDEAANEKRLSMVRPHFGSEPQVCKIFVNRESIKFDPCSEFGTKPRRGKR
jgi:hypothetical protein